MHLPPHLKQTKNYKTVIKTVDIHICSQRKMIPESQGKYKVSSTIALAYWLNQHMQLRKLPESE